MLQFTDATNATITGPGKITFTNEGVVDFYHRNISTVKSLSIDGSAWGSDPASSTGALTMRSNNNANLIGMSLGRTSSELEIGVSGGNGNYVIGTAAGDSVIRAWTGTNLFLSVSNGNPSVKMIRITIIATSGTSIQAAHLGLCWGHGNESTTQVGGTITHKSNNITMGSTTFSGNFFWAQLFTITNVTGNFQLTFNMTHLT